MPNMLGELIKKRYSWLLTIALVSSTSQPSVAEVDKVDNPHIGQMLYLYYQNRQFDALSYTLSQEALNTLPEEHLHSQLTKSAITYRFGLTDTANRTLKSIVTSSEQSPISQPNLIWLYIAKQYYLSKRYLHALEALANSQPDQLSAQDQQERLYIEAESHRQLNQLDSAKEVGQQLTPHSTNSLLFHYNLGFSYYNSGEPKLALESLQAGLSKAVSHPISRPLKERIHLLMGYIYLKNGEHALALNHYQSIHLNTPWLTDATLHYAWNLANDQQYDQGLAAIKHTLEQLPKEPLYWPDTAFQLMLLNGKLAQSAQRPKAAITHFEQCRTQLYQVKTDIEPYNQTNRLYELLEKYIENRHFTNSGDYPHFVTARLNSKATLSALRELQTLIVMETRLRDWQQRFELITLAIDEKRALRTEILSRLPKDKLSKMVKQYWEREHRLSNRLHTAEESLDESTLISNEQLVLNIKIANIDRQLKRVNNIIGRADAANLNSPIDTERHREYQQRITRLKQRALWESRYHLHDNLWRAKKELFHLTESLNNTQKNYDSLLQRVHHTAFLDSKKSALSQQKRQLDRLLKETSSLIDRYRQRVVGQLYAEWLNQNDQLQQYISYTEAQLAQLYEAEHNEQLKDKLPATPEEKSSGDQS